MTTDALLIALYAVVGLAIVALSARWLRRDPPEVDLTDEAYGRWARALRPQPLSWFLGLQEAQQTALATIGDRYVQDVAIGLGYAIQNPAAAEAGINQDQQAGEVELVQQLAQAAAAKILNRPIRTEPPRPAPGAAPTMGGMTRRREQRKAATTPPHAGPIFGGKPQGGAD